MILDMAETLDFVFSIVIALAFSCFQFRKEYCCCATGLDSCKTSKLNIFFDISLCFVFVYDITVILHDRNVFSFFSLSFS
jgi:hypothetical protein